MMFFNLPSPCTLAQGAFCNVSEHCDPCELTFSQKKSLFECRPSSSVVVFNTGDIDIDVTDDDFDVAELRRNIFELTEERAVLTNQLIAKDDDIVCLEASLGDLQAKLFEKTEELAWTKSQYQALSFKFEQLEKHLQHSCNSSINVNSNRSAYSIFIYFQIYIYIYIDSIFQFICYNSYMMYYTFLS